MITFIDHKTLKPLASINILNDINKKIKVNLNAQALEMCSRYFSMPYNNGEILYFDTNCIVSDGIAQFTIGDEAYIEDFDGHGLPMESFKDDVIIMTFPTFEEIIKNEELLDMAMKYSYSLDEYSSVEEYFMHLIASNETLNISFFFEGFFFFDEEHLSKRYLYKTIK